MSVPCPFCALPPERIVEENELAGCIRESYSVSHGHSLVTIQTNKKKIARG